MKMRQIALLFVFSIGLLLSCGKRIEKVKEDIGELSKLYFIDKHGRIQGEFLTMYQDGTIMEKANYKDDMMEGERILYNEKGELEIKEFYKNGILDGPFKTYYSNGAIQFEADYNQGILEGKTTKYYQSGEKMEEVLFVENKEEGPFVEFYENGNKKWEGVYHNGDNELGLLLNYNEEGELVKKMMCDSMAICQTIWTIDLGDITPPKISVTPSEQIL